jgi:hypothetical protein
MTGPNRDLAERLVRQADDAMSRRKVLLVASTALATTTSVPAAKRAITDPDLHISAAVRSAALTVLDEITSIEGTAP